VVLRVLGLPLDPPQTIINRVLSDLGAIARAARQAPAQLDRMLELGEEIVDIGRAVLEIAERLDERAAAILVLGASLDARAEAILELGARLDVRTNELIDLGIRMHELGDRVDARGAEVAGQASAVVETATELITVLPTLERALQLATPLEGAIDRFGRLVDRLPGGRRPDVGAPPAQTPRLAAGPAPGRPPRPPVTAQTPRKAGAHASAARPVPQASIAPPPEPPTEPEPEPEPEASIPPEPPPTPHKPRKRPGAQRPPVRWPPPAPPPADEPGSS
jgi:hypothetical protein